MSEDIDYCPGRSIAELPITSILHRPCPDLAGLVNYDPKKTQRALFLLNKLRDKYGFRTRKPKTVSQPMNYVCTHLGCIEPWGSVSNAEPEMD